eukprot:12174314-Ditylum_brightwellii.AAC.2
MRRIRFGNTHPAVAEALQIMRCFMSANEECTKTRCDIEAVFKKMGAESNAFFSTGMQPKGGHTKQHNKAQRFGRITKPDFQILMS